MSDQKVTPENPTKSQLTAERLRELFDYDPVSDIWHWRPPHPKQGKRAGTRGPKPVLQFGGKQRSARKLAFLYVHGRWPVGEVPSRGPLIEATRSDQAPLRAAPRTNTSGVKGVSWHQRLSAWRATIGIDYRQIHLGHFESFAEAVAARRAAEAKYWGPVVHV